MSQELNYDDAFESTIAMKAYARSCGTKSMRHVEVFKENDIFLSLQAEVVVQATGNGNVAMMTLIQWKQAGVDNFVDLGLREDYCSGFFCAEFNQKDTLTIHNENYTIRISET